MTVKQIIQQLQNDLAYYPPESDTAKNLNKEILRLKLLNNQLCTEEKITKEQDVLSSGSKDAIQ